MYKQKEAAAAYHVFWASGFNLMTQLRPDRTDAINALLSSSYDQVKLLSAFNKSVKHKEKLNRILSEIEKNNKKRVDGSKMSDDPDNEMIASILRNEGLEDDYDTSLSKLK